MTVAEARALLLQPTPEPTDKLIIKHGHSEDVTRWKFLKSKTVGVIAAPFSGGQPKGGVEHGPLQLIEYGLIEQLESLDWTVDWDQKMPHYEQFHVTEDPQIGKLRKPRFVGETTHIVSNQVKAVAEKGEFALTLGGDHSLAIATIAGTSAVYGNDLTVIWVDAHADINIPETTTSGNIHGCPVAFLLGIAGDVAPFSWLRPCLSPDRIVYIGLRDVDAPEKKILSTLGIKAFSMYEVDKYGIAKVMEMAIEHVRFETRQLTSKVNPGRNRPIHLSFDVDALDPQFVPSTGTPVRGGLTFREGHFICEALAETGLLVAMDVMEVNPLIGDQTNLLQTVSIGCGLVRSSLGETLL
jgi:arginase